MFLLVLCHIPYFRPRDPSGTLGVNTVTNAGAMDCVCLGTINPSAKAIQPTVTWGSQQVLSFQHRKKKTKT